MEKPGDAPVAPEAPEAPETVDKPGDAPVAPEAPEAPETVDKPGDAPVAPEAPEAPETVEKPGDAPVAPEAPEAPETVDKPGDAPENPGEFEGTEPEAPKPTDRLDHADKLENLDEKVIVDIVEPTPEPAPEPDVTAGLEPILEIPDEIVPLADAPKTGDLSGLWAFLSSFSLGGMALLNRKRKEEN